MGVYWDPRNQARRGPYSPGLTLAEKVYWGNQARRGKLFWVTSLEEWRERCERVERAMENEVVYVEPVAQVRSSRACQR